VSGQYHEAARAAGEGLHLAGVSGFGLLRTRLAVLGARSALPGDTRRAAALAQAALDSAGAEDAWGRAEALHWAGAALLRTGERGLARQRLTEALALRSRIRHPGRAATEAMLSETG
jgi:hypothetical protein